MRHAIVTCAVPCRAFVKTEGPGRRMDSSPGRGHTGREIDHFGFSDCCCYFCCCYIPPLGLARIVFQTKQDARHSFFFGATALPALHRALGTATSIFCVVGKSFCNNWSVDSTRRVGKGGKNLLNVTLPSPSPSPAQCGAVRTRATRYEQAILLSSTIQILLLPSTFSIPFQLCRQMTRQHTLNTNPIYLIFIRYAALRLFSFNFEFLFHCHFYRASASQALMDPMRLCRQRRAHQLLLQSNRQRSAGVNMLQRSERLQQQLHGGGSGGGGAGSKQAEICRKEPQVLHEIVKGAQLGTKECQQQFKNRRWNCTTARKSLRKVVARGRHSFFLIYLLFFTWKIAIILKVRVGLSRWHW